MKAATVKSELINGKVTFTIVKPMQEMTLPELNADRAFTENQEGLKREREHIQKCAIPNTDLRHMRFIG